MQIKALALKHTQKNTNRQVHCLTGQPSQPIPNTANHNPKRLHTQDTLTITVKLNMTAMTAQETLTVAFTSS